MNEIEIAGIKRELRHLREVIVTVLDKGKDGADLRVAISFGLHTISTGCDHGQHYMFDKYGKPRLVITSCHSREVAFSRIKRRFNIHTLLRKCLYEAKRIP